MSVDACVAFLEVVRQSTELQQELKAMTDTSEIVALGRRRGYDFDSGEIAAAASRASYAPGARPIEEPEPRAVATKTAFYHYEFDLDTLPAFANVVAILPELEIKPPTVDLGRFERAFRQDDLDWTDMSPAAREFSDIYEEIMCSHWSDGDETTVERRDFHLVNLDKHTSHAFYEGYLAAKIRMITELELIFSGNVQFSGSLWYPPRSYRLWHTNETQPGWRMYLIDLDGGRGMSGTSFFRYMNPESKGIVTLEDRPKSMRLFKIEQEQDKLLWHCIVNPSDRNRWSFGFAVPDDWAERLGVAHP